MINVATATDAELYAELERIEDTPCDDERTEQALIDRADRIEQELDRRASYGEAFPSDTPEPAGIECPPEWTER